MIHGYFTEPSLEPEILDVAFTEENVVTLESMPKAFYNFY